MLFYEDQDIEHIMHIFKSHDTSVHEVVWKQTDTIENLQHRMRSLQRENKELRNQQQDVKAQLTEVHFLIQQMMKQQETIVANTNAVNIAALAAANQISSSSVMSTPVSNSSTPTQEGYSSPTPSNSSSNRRSGRPLPFVRQNNSTERVSIQPLSIDTSLSQNTHFTWLNES